MTAVAPSPKANRSPLAWLAAAFAFGVVAAAGTGWQPSVYILIGIAGLAAAWFTRERAAFAACCFAFAALGGFCYSLELGSAGETRLRPIYDEGRIASGDPVEIKGTVKGGPEPAYDGVFVKLDVSELVHRGETRAASGVLRFYLPLGEDEARADLARLDLRHGSIVAVACSVMREDAYLNPGVTPRREMLDRQGIDATCTVKSPLMIERLGHEWSPLSFVFELRRQAIERIRELFRPRTAGVLIASSLGDKYFLDRETAEVFREGGTFHVLVISGLHVTFIGGLLLLAVRRFTRRRLPQFLVTTAVLWAFTIAVGAESPAVRASVMFTIALFGFAIFRRMTLLNAFGASGLVLLVLRPSDVFDPSFQLTFASVGGIVAMAFPLVEKLRAIGGWMPTTAEPFPPNVPGWLRRFCETIYWNPREWEIDQTRQVWSANIWKSPLISRLADIGLRRPAAFVFEGLLVSVVVQLWMLPLLVWYFHRVSISSVLLNLWVGPLLAVESFAAAAALALDAVAAWLAVPMVYVTETLNDALLWLPGVFVEQGWASFRLPVAASEWWMYPLFLLPVGVLAFLATGWDPFALQRQSKTRTAVWVAVPAVLIAAIGIAMLNVSPAASAGNGKLTVRFLDVGQGDSAFIVFPNGETMLVDGGGLIDFRKSEDDDTTEPFEPDVARIGEMVVSETLWELGHSRIDHLVASHADTDHIQGLVDAAKNFEIGTAYFAGVQGESEDAAELLAVLSRKGVPIEWLESGGRLEIGGASIDILHPSAADAELTENDRSLVFALTFGERRFLFTGDIEAEAERRIVENGSVPISDVVKVPHHGSRTSSSNAFVEAVKPHVAVIPVGKRSRFGHPHSEVTVRWSEAGSRVITTGERGMVTISTDGRRMQVETFLP